VEKVPGRIKKSFNEHYKILKTVLKGNEEEATALMKEHIASTRDSTINYLL